MYNILYTLLCIFVLSTVLCGLACLCVQLDRHYSNEYIKPLLTIHSGLILYFLGCKMFDKNNYS